MIRSEIKEKEMKETIAKIHKTKSWFFKKINKMNIRRLKKGEEKADRLRISEPKEQHSSEFPAFSFFLFSAHISD